MLNDFFSTVFTREDVMSAPVLKPVCDAKLVDIEVSVDVIMKKLSSLKRTTPREMITCRHVY